jgi:hypothetical protein
MILYPYPFLNNISDHTAVRTVTIANACKERAERMAYMPILVDLAEDVILVACPIEPG